MLVLKRKLSDGPMFHLHEIPADRRENGHYSLLQDINNTLAFQRTSLLHFVKFNFSSGGLGLNIFQYSKNGADTIDCYSGN
jgi:hypothetical protein